VIKIQHAKQLILRIAAVILGATAAGAQTYPTRPITVVIPFNATLYDKFQFHQRHCACRRFDPRALCYGGKPNRSGPDRS
jgi:hypothetical protein